MLWVAGGGGCGEVWFAGQGFRSVVDGWGRGEILRGGVGGMGSGCGRGAEERKRVLAVGGQGPVGGWQRGCGVVGQAATCYAAMLVAGGVRRIRGG